MGADDDSLSQAHTLAAWSKGYVRPSWGKARGCEITGSSLGLRSGSDPTVHLGVSSVSFIAFDSTIAYTPSHAVVCL